MSTPLSTQAITWTDDTVEKINNITFMRARNINFSADACKPNTKLYPFFDDVRIDSFVTPTGKTLGADLVTDQSGSISGVFSLPPNRFTVGVKNFMLSQNTTTLLNGHITGDAVASFQSFGYAQSLRKTTTSISQSVTIGTVTAGTATSIRRVIEVPAAQQTVALANTVRTTATPVTVTASASSAGLGTNNTQIAPSTQSAVSNLVYAANSERTYTLAQSFNTFGLVDGVFVTSVDVYFRSKSATSPVILELRTMLLGYPTETLVSKSSKAIVQAAAVKVSETAAEFTRFTFDFPIYLAASADYCFVVRSNSTEYNLFVSEVGGISVETNKMISEQPFVGSLFKSENNNTWTPEAYKDVKFKINRAKFNTTSTAFVNTSIKPVPYYISGRGITTFKDSRIVRVDCNYYKHGLDSTSKVDIKTNGQPTAIYNGFTDANMNGTFDVSRIINDYVFEFRLNLGTCVKTAFIETADQVTSIFVENGGTLYSQPTVEIVGGGGTGATATAAVVAGAITAVTVTTPGQGYTSAPTVTIKDASGSGAVVKAYISTYFEVTTNNVSDVVVTNIASNIVSGTDIRAELSLTAAGYAGLATQSIHMNEANYIGTTAIVASDSNEIARLGGNESSMLTHSLYSTNDYVSPMIFIKGASIVTSNFHINWQTGETINSTAVNGTGRVQSIIIGNAGSSYTGTPTVVVSKPDTTGETAVATATILGGVLTAVTVTSGGTGYTRAPVVTVSGGGGTGAAVTAQLTKFNTELLATGGTALSRYISNITGLATASTGAVVYVDAHSHIKSSFEVYLRTTLAVDTSIHKQQPWRLMDCATERNLSVLPEQVLEYKFALNTLPEFDTFDIKIILRSLDSANPPVIKSYRAVIVV